MKKTVAILFILILAFNMCGYRLILPLLQKKAAIQLETRIDSHEYNEADLIEMRVSLNMPYQNRYTDFERHYGEITIEGKAYTYVKRKIEGDVLVLKCIANESKEKIKATADNIAKSNSGQEQNNDAKKQSSSIKGFSGDYDDNNQFFALAIADLSTTTIGTYYQTSLNDALLKTPHQPPKAC